MSKKHEKTFVCTMGHVNLEYVTDSEEITLVAVACRHTDERGNYDCHEDAQPTPPSRPEQEARAWNPELMTFVYVIDMGADRGLARYEVRLGREVVYVCECEELAMHKCASLTTEIAAYAAHLRQLQKEQDGWIPVSQRLPEEGEEVEIYTNANRRLIAKRRSNYFEFSLQGTCYCFHWQDDVTHWRPLPEPPIAAAIRSQP